MIKMPEIGDPLPWIDLRTSREASMPLNGLAGHSVVLGCAGPEIAVEAIVEALEKASAILAEQDAYWLVVVAAPIDGTPPPALRNPRARIIIDPDGSARGALGFAANNDGMLCVGADSGLRVVAAAHHRGPAALSETEIWLVETLVNGSLGNAGEGAEVDAPVLLIPNVIEAALREKLIAAWGEGGAEATGYLRPNEDGSLTHVVNADRKRRRDHFLADDDPLAGLVHARIRSRVVPWIERATHFRIGFAERYRIACYEAEGAGFFAPHRDFSKASAHRHFAMTIALNDGYQGGALRFPEFGSREYLLRPGQAIVYSGSLLHEVTPMTAGSRFVLINFLTNGEGAKTVADYQRDHGATPEHKTVG